MRALILLVVLTLGACGDSGERTGSEDRIFDTQRQALDKAKDVGDTVMDAAARQREAEDAQAR